MEPANENATASAGEPTEAARLAGAPVEDQEIRSNYGTVPGSEFPPSVYVSVFVAFAWILLASWVAFAGEGDADLALSFVIVLTLVFFALPFLVYLTARHRSSARTLQGDFLSTPVDTWTGTLTGASAWLQILLIPAALALAATLIGATNLLVHWASPLASAS